MRTIYSDGSNLWTNVGAALSAADSYESRPRWADPARPIAWWKYDRELIGRAPSTGDQPSDASKYTTYPMLSTLPPLESRYKSLQIQVWTDLTPQSDKSFTRDEIARAHSETGMNSACSGKTEFTAQHFGDYAIGSTLLESLKRPGREGFDEQGRQLVWSKVLGCNVVLQSWWCLDTRQSDTDTRRQNDPDPNPRQTHIGRTKTRLVRSSQSGKTKDTLASVTEEPEGGDDSTPSDMRAGIYALQSQNSPPIEERTGPGVFVEGTEGDDATRVGGEHDLPSDSSSPNVVRGGPDASGDSSKTTHRNWLSWILGSRSRGSVTQK